MSRDYDGDCAKAFSQFLISTVYVACMLTPNSASEVWSKSANAQLRGSRRLCGTMVSLLLMIAGCDATTGKSKPAYEKPATVAKLPLEINLATVTLSADAVRRLGITTQPVELRQVSQRRTLGGEAIVPVGKSLVVTAPVTGIVASPNYSPIPQPGTHVEQNDPVLMLVPLLTPERDVPTPAEQVQLVGARANLMAAQIAAQGDVERSRAEVEAANINFQRAEKLFQDRAGARRAVDDATAQLAIAKTVLQAATNREHQLVELLALLQAKPIDGKASPLPLLSPSGGIINRLSVSAGQTVASGTLLFEVVNLDMIWIRVPVFVDLLSTIQKDRPVGLVSLSGKPFGNAANVQTVEARPIAAPPTADALNSSADLYYEIDNRALGLRPGQRVGVELPLRGASEALVVPYASILLTSTAIPGSTSFLANGSTRVSACRFAGPKARTRS